MDTMKRMHIIEISHINIFMSLYLLLGSICAIVSASRIESWII